MASETRVATAVTATIRHSDNSPTAREAAMTAVNRYEADSAERAEKPGSVPGDLNMAGILASAVESPR